MAITMIFQALHKLVPTYLSRVLLNLIGHSVLALAREWWSGGIYGSSEGLEGGWGTKMYRMPARCHYFISSSETRTKYNFVHCIAEGTRSVNHPCFLYFKDGPYSPGYMPLTGQSWLEEKLTGSHSLSWANLFLPPGIEIDVIWFLWHQNRENLPEVLKQPFCHVCWKARELVRRKEGWRCWVHRVMIRDTSTHPH